jgi:hypothetical protein
MSSKRTSEPLPLEGFLFSEKDLEALRRSRSEVRPFSLARIDELFPKVFPVAPRRTTSEGWEPFQLEETKEP